MTSGLPVNDIRAALAHVNDAVLKLTGTNKTDAQKIATSLTALLTKLGGVL